MSRTKRSFWKVSLSVLANVSYKTLILDGLFVSFCECLVRNAHFRSFPCPFLRMSRTKRSFWKVSLSVFANVSYKTFILEGLFVSFCECLVQNAHFGRSLCQFLRMSRTKRSFWKVSLSVFANVSYETLILEGLFVSFCECLVRNAHFGSSLCQFLRMSRTKRSFWKVSLSVLANVSYERLILDGLFVSFCECLVRNAHLGRSLCPFLRTSRTKRSFWKVSCCLHSSSTLLTAGSDADEHLSAERVLNTKCDEWPPEDGHKNSKSKNQKNQKHYQKKLNSSGCDGKKVEQLKRKVRKTRCLGCFGWLFRLCLFVGFVGSDAASASCFLVAIKPGLNGPLDNETNALSRPMCAVDPGDTPLDSSAGFPAAPILELLQCADVAPLQINCSFFDDFAVDWGFDGRIFWGLWGVTVCVLTTVTCWIGGCYRRPKRRKSGREKQKKKNPHPFCEGAHQNQVQRLCLFSVSKSWDITEKTTQNQIS